MITTTARTAAATRTRMRASEEKLAQKLRDRGWVVISPEHAARVNARLAERAMSETKTPDAE